jgi:hypothetical protein
VTAPVLQTDDIIRNLTAGRSADFFDAPGIRPLLERMCDLIVAGLERVAEFIRLDPKSEAFRELCALHEREQEEILIRARTLHVMPGDLERGLPPPRLQ